MTQIKPHPNIIQLYGVVRHPMAIVTELADGGSGE